LSHHCLNSIQFHPWVKPLGQRVNQWRRGSFSQSGCVTVGIGVQFCMSFLDIYIYVCIYMYYTLHIYIMYMMYITLFKSDDQIVWDYIFRFSVRSRWSGDELEPQVILVAGFNPLKKCSPLGIVIPTDGLLHSMDHRVECPVLLDWMDRSRSENNLGSWHALQHREITTVKQISICQ